MEAGKERIVPLAQDVLSISKAQLLVAIRFLDRALFELHPEPLEDAFGIRLATDGYYLFFEPMTLLRAYRKDQSYPVRVWAHMLMHCLYRHMFIGLGMERRMWDLACDMAAEAVVLELNIRQLQSAPGRVTRMNALEAVGASVKTLTAEHIYRYLLDNPLQESTLEEWERAFAVDNHVLWYLPRLLTKVRASVNSGSSDKSGDGDGSSKNPNDQDDQKNGDGSDQNEDQNDDQNEGQNGKGSGQNDDQDGNGSGQGDDQNEKQSRQSSAALNEMWKDIAERVQTDLETFSKGRGDTPGSMLQSLRSINRERCDYRQFLRKFAARTEVMRLSPDEYDYVFYTFGLEHYHDMPLIEPLEYREDKRIREFVIAIDTSGSVAGDQVQKFLQKTFTILKQEETFAKKFNLHIIQCDSEIQEDVEIRTQEEFDHYIQTMEIRGLGGTNFKPVFERVEELRREKRFTNLKGLIYFTDGEGIFPDKQPDYLTAFIFVDDNPRDISVPPWAIKIVMETEDLMQL